ncbi:PKD domain-containing protein [uncultured Tenacibaculum sp.]|uniref:SwmB domain-containing protein n=1 Tax=uncultured Tenacibaculum sp. TaxID=174713 RepID=UPI002605036D|nr:PKD domain-containing protein [uncultured Tenacibaculum sp.]
MKKIKLKNIIPLILISLTGALLIQCDKEETVLIEPNQRAIFTSEMDFDNRVNVNQDIDFADASAGVVSRTWTFPENVVDIDGSDNDQTSSNKIVKAFFNQPGTYNVTLNQTFKGDVFANGQSTGSNVADTTIVVNVLSEVNIGLTANILNDDGTLGAPLVIADNAENEVIASEKVRFSYTVTGDPDIFEWTFNGASPDTFDGSDVDVDVTYRSLGVHDLKFIARRDRPSGGDTISVKNLIKVIPSTEPVNLISVNEIEGKVGLEFSRDMDPASADASQFNITLENNGAIIPVNITNIDVDSNFPNILVLTLNETVFRDDEVTVSYTPGTLATTDRVNADAIPQTPVGFDRLENMLESILDYSFENSTNINDEWPDNMWGGMWAMYTREASSIRAKTGTNSLLIEYQANGGMIINSGPATVPTEQGQTYELGFWIYVESLGNSDPSQFLPEIRFFADPPFQELGIVFFDSAFPTGQWLYQSLFFTANSTEDAKLLIRGFNQFNPEPLRFFIDDLTLRKVNLRP